MKNVKLRFITVLSVLALIALVCGFAFAGFLPSRRAFAASYSPTTIFAQGTGGDVKTYKENAEADKSYTTFVLSDEGNVFYRRNLALKWYEAAEEGASSGVNPGQVRFFELSFKFAGVNFDTFTIQFESAEENVTKEGKATNAIVFTKDGDSVKVAVKNGDREPGNSVTVDPDEWINLSLSDKECSAGEFGVYLNGANAPFGKLVNVGGNYLEYRSSASTTPSTPMTFSAEISREDAKQKVFMNRLNGQMLEVTDGTAAETAEADGTVAVTGGNIIDNEPAALVLNEVVHAFRLGQRFSLSYQAIDVCDDSVSATRQYYMAKKVDGDYKKGEDSDYKTLTTSTYFMPTGDLDKDDQIIYVSIRIRLDDGTNKDEYVYLTWYAHENALAEIGAGDDAFDYIKVDRNQKGPFYSALQAQEEGNGGTNVKDPQYDAAVEAYQQAVTELAEDEKVSAGDGAYFYLPSLRGLIGSNTADYRNLKFTVSFYNQSQEAGSATPTTETSLNYNSLRFEIKKEGSYKFRVFAADAAGNGMQYYDKDGQLVTVTSSNVWDIEGIPEFTFEAKYTGVVIEEAGEQSLGYRETSYSITSFDVISLDGIEKEYRLYHLNMDELKKIESEPSYKTLVTDAAKYMSDEKYANCFTEIKEYDDEIDEDDEEWDESHNAYQWRPSSSSLSFNPQESGYYFVELLVTDSRLSNEVTKGYQVIEVRNPFDYTPGQSQWLQNNVISIVLFSISAILLVVIVVLFVVKPSDKKVEEVDLSKLKGKKKTGK